MQKYTFCIEENKKTFFVNKSVLLITDFWQFYLHLAGSKIVKTTILGIFKVYRDNKSKSYFDKIFIAIQNNRYKQLTLILRVKFLPNTGDCVI